MTRSINNCPDCDGVGVKLQSDDSDSIGLHIECETCNPNGKLIHICPDCDWPCNCSGNPCECSCADDELD